MGKTESSEPTATLDAQFENTLSPRIQGFLPGVRGLALDIRKE